MQGSALTSAKTRELHVVSRGTSLRRQPLRVSPVGLVCTLVLHGVVLFPLVVDWGLPSHPLPDRNGAGASAIASDQVPVITAIFINEESAVESARPPQLPDLASRGVAQLDLPIVVLSPDALPATEVPAEPEKADDDSTLPEVAGDQTQHTLLYGRYMGQLQARIERAWMRPRSDIGAPKFSCRAQIEQDRRGNLVDIKLDHCNGTDGWRKSLVSAIRTASPLPAPPDPSVYADRLWLNFESDGFTVGAPAEGFEPPARDSFSAIDRYEEMKRFEHFAGQAGSKTAASHDQDGTSVIHLTIVGSPSNSTRPQAGELDVPAPEPAPEPIQVPSQPDP